MITTANPTIEAHQGDVLPHDLVTGGEASLPVRVEVAEDGSTLTVIWVEDLAWHHETFSEVLKPLCDEEGFLSEEAAETAASVVQEYLNDNNVEALHDHGEEWDDPSFAVSVQYVLGNGAETTEEEAVEVFWDFVATMANLTDPGTFGVEYLFGATAHRLG